MLKKTTHQRRVELGNWLQKLLNPKINKWEIFPIINEAITLLDISFPLDKRDYFFQLIANFQQNEPRFLKHDTYRCYEQLLTFIMSLYDLLFTETEEYTSGDGPDFDKINKLESVAIEFQKQINWAEFPQINFYENIPTGEDKDFISTLKTLSFLNEDIRSELVKEFRVKYNLPKPIMLFGKSLPKNHQEKYKEEVLNNPKLTSFDERIISYARLHNPIRNVLTFFDQRELISILLKKIKEQDKPWNLFVPRFCHENSNARQFFKGESCKIRIPFMPPDLISSYNKLNEHLHLKNDSLALERTLLDRYFRPEISSEENEVTYSELPTDVLISNIFFDFLLCGGQDYFGFCEYCDSFFVIERKNRKKFCSDVCRTMNQRK